MPNVPAFNGKQSLFQCFNKAPTTKQVIGRPTEDVTGRAENAPQPRTQLHNFFASIKSFFTRIAIALHKEVCTASEPRAQKSDPFMISSRVSNFSVRLSCTKNEAGLRKLSKDIEEFAKEHPATQSKLETLLQQIGLKLSSLGAHDYIPPTLGMVYNGG